MTVTVSAGSAWILGTNISYQGAYNFVNDSQVVLNVDAAHASLGRRDIVVARIQDASVSGSVNSATLEVIPGTPASSPVVPATPANAIKLATIIVNANATSITNSNIDRSGVPVAFAHRQLTSDVVVVTSTTRPGSSDRFVGMQILETDTQRRWIWNGSNWAYQGGGSAPVAIINSGTATNRAAGTAAIYWMSKNTSWFDNNYFTFINGTNGSSPDAIKVTQSGMYLVNVYVDMVQSGPGFYAHAYPGFVPTISGLKPIPGQGSQVYTNGRSYSQVTQVHYLSAGTDIRVYLYNSVVVNVRQVGLTVTMLP